MYLTLLVLRATVHAATALRMLQACLAVMYEMRRKHLTSGGPSKIASLQ